MSNHVRELTNQANDLTAHELDHVTGGRKASAAALKDLPVLKLNMQVVLLTSS